jgi:hypothetical protein
VTHPLVKPGVYEVVTGWGADRKVIYAHSMRDAEREFLRLLKAGQQPSIWLGNGLIREPA